jgi:hypothetical protein
MTAEKTWLVACTQDGCDAVGEVYVTPATLSAYHAGKGHAIDARPHGWEIIAFDAGSQRYAGRCREHALRREPHR